MNCVIVVQRRGDINVNAARTGRFSFVFLEEYEDSGFGS